MIALAEWNARNATDRGAIGVVRRATWALALSENPAHKPNLEGNPPMTTITNPAINDAFPSAIPNLSAPTFPPRLSNSIEQDTLVLVADIHRQQRADLERWIRERANNDGYPPDRDTFHHDRALAAGALANSITEALIRYVKAI